MAYDREKERKAGKAMAVGSSIFGLCFAIFWCIAAASMGAWFMLLFGIPFVGMVAWRLRMTLKFAKEEETKPPQTPPEPWDRPDQTPRQEGSGFCPYCGAALGEGFAFCPKCGRRV